MTPEQAIKTAAEMFPFAGYMGTQVTIGAYKNIAEVLLQHLAPGSRLLDFGCGPCDKTAVLQLLGYNCSAYDDLNDDWHLANDNRQKIMQFAGKIGIDFTLANQSPLPYQPESFDGVMLLDVLEHLHDSPRPLLDAVLRLIKPEGLLLITVPNAVNIRKRLHVLTGRTNLPDYGGYYWSNGVWRGHIREYVKDDLRQLASFQNLQILALKGCDHMLDKVPAKMQKFYQFITSIFPGWKDTWLLIARKPANWAPIVEPTR